MHSSTQMIYRKRDTYRLKARSAATFLPLSRSPYFDGSFGLAYRRCNDIETYTLQQLCALCASVSGLCCYGDNRLSAEWCSLSWRYIEARRRRWFNLFSSWLSENAENTAHQVWWRRVIHHKYTYDRSVFAAWHIRFGN